MTILSQDYFINEGIQDTIITMDGIFMDRRWGRFAKENELKVVTKQFNEQEIYSEDPIVEEVNRVIWIYASRTPGRWTEVLTKIEWLINNTNHLSVGLSPVKIRRRETEKWILDPRLQPKVKNNIPEREMTAIMNRARDEYRWRSNRRIARKIRRKEIKEEQLVWLQMHRKQQTKDEWVKRIRTDYQGPYRVTSYIRDKTYVVEDLKGRMIGVKTRIRFFRT